MHLTHRIGGNDAVEPPSISIELGQIPATSQIRYRNPHEHSLNPTVPKLRDLPHSPGQKFNTFRDAIERNG
ncbi:hypothetical protein GGQ79_000250 [Ochrobactrum pecoris]|uniref:Uncharacterized protein n=1 Tax=Brucella pecoris TaxID=867683 RepID=A0AB34YM90_9HYPH|nr:hypothetical protein [Brucella pecoris]